MVSNRRARTAEAKRNRRESILDAAARLVRTAEPSRLRMDDVAAAAGVAKGTLYLYFSRRSDLLAAVADRALLSWLGAVETAVRADLRIRGVRPLAEAMVGPLRHNPEIISHVGLYCGGHDTRDAEAESYAAFQLVAGRLGRLLESRLPDRRAGDGLRLVLLARAVLTGLAQLPRPVGAPTPLIPAPTAGSVDVLAEVERLFPAILASA